MKIICMCTGSASARSILHVQCFRKKRGIMDVALMFTLQTRI